MQPDLIAKILPTKAQGGRTIGTGYPITKDLVLTARHVVIFEDRDSNVPISIEWPDLKDDTGKFCSSTVSEIIEFGEQYDIALLKCEVPLKARNSLPNLTQHFPAPHENWGSLGYPRIGRDDGVRNKVSALGEFHPSDNTHQIQLTSESDAIEKEGWCGISGAPVFNGNTLYAVISKTPSNRQECFTAVLIPWLIINRPEFSSAIGFSEKKVLPLSLIPLDVDFAINVDHLPQPTTALIGRKTELAQLTEAFINPNIRLAIIVASGGIGKSALTDEWLIEIGKPEHNYYGKTRVFGWSFYAQGTHTTYTNSQEFFSAVLPFLGISEIPKEEDKKARLLAQCLQQQPCLLILDGLEPLQYAQNLSAMNGELQDSALKEFIACFRRTAGNSFVLFSSRQPLVELKRWQTENYLSLDLKILPHDDGADLLKTLGVTGKAQERLAISQDLNGHALSLVLLGHLLKEYHDGDPRYAKELPPLTVPHGNSDAEKDNRHAVRVLDYYDSLQDDTSRRFLQLLDLFDRPMNAAEKADLISKANHAEPLRALTAQQWQAIEQRLEKSGVLLGKKGSFERLEWDTHPIIRAYFGQKFKDNHPETFKQAHKVLFEYFQKLPKKEYPDTLEEMLPLYRAVVHGCLAGKYLEALENVYWRRVLRTDKHYSHNELGTFSQELTALAAFFPCGWSKPIQTGLNKNWQAWLLAEVSLCLTSLGRLLEAIEPRLANLILRKAQEDWESAANTCQNLVELYLPLGQLTLAQTAAQLTVDYAQCSKNKFLETGGKSCLATLLHRIGNLKEAFEHFQQAEKIRGFTNSGLDSFFYFALLIESTNDKTVWQALLERANCGLNFSTKHHHLISIALDYLTLARISIVLNDKSKAKIYFEESINGIQKANTLQYTPPFYLYRADFYLILNQLDPALADLMSAYEIIKRCGMKLYQIDYLLIHGRYSLVTKDFDTALSHYDEAKQLINQTGYHLRDAELDLFAAKLRQDCGEEYRSTNTDLYAKTADDYLQKAKQRIADIGQWGLLRVIERDFPSSS